MKISSIILTSAIFHLSFFVLQSLPAAPMSDWTNVRDFGAKGDGVADDTAALQKCFDTLENGTTVYFPEGVYNVSSMLVLRHAKKRLLGVTLIGEGAGKSVFRWTGADYGRVFRLAGLAHSRFVDFGIDGGGRAAIGFWSDTENKFQTQDRFTRLAFRGFRTAGFFSEPNDRDGTSDSEPTFEYCLFESCTYGIHFECWNDYDFTIRGCTFRKNAKAGVYCSHGCFYLSACRFERNRIDVEVYPEHASSIRRSVSVGSGAFVKGGLSVTPVTIENCTVADWTDPEGAIRYNGTLLGFGNTFRAGAVATALQPNARHVLLAADREPLRLPETTVFSPKSRPDGRVFDAKRDFGAKGDGRTDDTAALRAMIAAARAAGDGAVAYLPKGEYRLTGTLEIGGTDWTLRGTGILSALLHDGDHDEPAIRVQDAGTVELALFRVQNLDTYRGNHDVAWDGGKGANILQLPGSSPSRVTYREVFVYGKYETAELRDALRESFVFRDLTERDVVNLNYVEGNLRFENCGDATVVGGVCYEGAIVVDGPTGKGFLGCQTRLATLVTCPLIVRKNGSFTASDFYLEQERDLLYRLSGGADHPRGRLTLGHPKVSRELPKGQTVDPKLQRWAFLDGGSWQGDFCLVGAQFYKAQSALNECMFRAGSGLDVTLVAPVFYSAYPTLAGGGTLSLVGGWGTDDSPLPKNVPPPPIVSAALGDLTRLGELDLLLNYDL